MHRISFKQLKTASGYDLDFFMKDIIGYKGTKLKLCRHTKNTRQEGCFSANGDH